jgi:predicted transposase
MKIQRTVKLKLLPSEEQADLLQRTMETYCNALNDISQVAHELGNCRNYLTLHRLVYYEVRERFGHKSQQTISAQRQVAAAYKAMKANGNEQGKTSFNFRGGLLLQQGRDYGLKVEQEVVGITTLAGRRPMAFSCGDFQRQHFDWKMGSATLVKRRGVFWLHVVFWREVEEADEEAAETVIGVDRGMNYLAVARAPDGGTSFHGGGQVHCTCGTAQVHCTCGTAQVKQRKHHYRRVRASLQATHALARSASEGTKGAKRTLKRLSGREKRYQRAVNHVVSKEIDQRPVIVLEELGGIRQRARQRKAQRGDFHSWALPKACQLAQFVEYPGGLCGSSGNLAELLCMWR